MKRQPSLCHCCPCHGRCHCDRRHHLHRCHRLRCHCRRSRPLPSPLANAIVVAVDLHHRCLCCVAISHRPCRCPCRWPLPSPSPSAIAVAIFVSHHCCRRRRPFLRVVPWRGKNCIRPIETKNAYFILFCSDSGGRTDQSQMTDQVSSGDGQH
jgi:hypothetical protein